eukprot:6197966-Pleurochrysis_carterae.AAC.2
MHDALQAYMVSAAWITSGILTCTQVFRAKIRGTKYYLGTGLISVMGTSFTFLPIAREMVTASIGDAKQAGLCETNENGIEDCRGFGMKGFGEVTFSASHSFDSKALFRSHSSCS